MKFIDQEVSYPVFRVFQTKLRQPQPDPTKSNQTLQNPAGKSESINSYMRLVMNLMKVYSTGETNQDMVRKQS